MARAFHRVRKQGHSRGGAGSPGALEGQLDAAERALLASLFDQTRQLLESIAPPAKPDGADELPEGSPDDPLAAMMSDAQAALSGLAGLGSDPALHRLLPDAHRNDPLASAEFRRTSQESVRVGKITRIEAAIAVLATADDQGRISLAPAQAQQFLVALTDVRLVLGQRLGLTADGDVEAVEEELAQAPDDDPRVPLILAYDFTTWLQEGLASALLP